LQLVAPQRKSAERTVPLPVAHYSQSTQDGAATVGGWPCRRWPMSRRYRRERAPPGRCLGYHQATPV